jgi:CRISPR type I-E-associated protein CasA/Cse1
LYDHTDDNSGFLLSPAGAARMLVTLHAFGLGGLSGIGEKHVDAPCAGGVLFFVHGENLFQTLLLNLPAYPEEAFFKYDDEEEDLPAWEQDNPYNNERVYPSGLVDYLTWQSRQPLLFFQAQPDSQVSVTQYNLGPGRRLGGAIYDPFKVYLRSKQSGDLPLHFSEDKGLWRNSAALFNFDASDTPASRAPATFHWLASLIQHFDDEQFLPRSKTYRCLALGLSKKRGKMLFTRHEMLPLLPAYLSDHNLVNQLTSALDLTDLVARDMLRAARITGMHLFVANAEQVEMKSLAKSARAEIDNWVAHSGVERAYWAALDVPFQSFLVRLPAEGSDAVVAWQQTLHDTALAALDATSAYTAGDGRGLKALVYGQRTLFAGLRKNLPLLYSALDGTEPVEPNPADADDTGESDDADSDEVDDPALDNSDVDE